MAETWWQNNPYLTKLHEEKKPNWSKRWTSWQPENTGEWNSPPLWWKNDNNTTPLKGSTWLPEETYTSLWSALPNGKKNEVYAMANQFRNPYLQAMSYGEAMIQFNGQLMKGVDAAAAIAQLNADYHMQLEQSRANTRANVNRELDYRISPQSY